MMFNRIINWFQAWPDVLKFLGLIAVTVFATYYVPGPVRMIWYVAMLAAYFFSRNEALWLAVFLATTDGFFSFFGVYAATLTVLPGLPAVEIAQIYIILTVIKAASRKVQPELFYNKYLQILFIYLLFNIIWGQMMGLSGGLNVYFRMIKGFLPMLLFYSVPRLFGNQVMYDRFFRLVFVIILFAFSAQLFTLFTGRSPIEAGGISLAGDQEDEGEFRVFYSVGSALTGMFAALYSIGTRDSKANNLFLPYVVVFSALAMAFLSATRGWIIGFALIILLVVIFTGVIRSGRSILVLAVTLLIVTWAFTNPTISNQVSFARERLEKIEAISEGDLTAGGTLMRLDYRSQRAMGGWKQNPIFGWGLSDKGYEYGDGHVGNQSLLATSGLVGYLLLNGFLAWFIYKIITVYSLAAGRLADRNRLLVFVFFLTGWFFIHSTSGQQFNYVGMPANIIPQAVFFSFGAFQYQRTLKIINGKKV